MTPLLPYRLYPRLDRRRQIIWTGELNLVGRPCWISVAILRDSSVGMLRSMPGIMNLVLEKRFDHRGYPIPPSSYKVGQRQQEVAQKIDRDRMQIRTGYWLDRNLWALYGGNQDDLEQLAERLKKNQERMREQGKPYVK